MSTEEIERLEHEADATRTRVTGLMDELQERIAPGKVMEELMDFARDGIKGATLEAARNLGQQAQKNPVPFLLIGAGLAWLAFSDKKAAADAGVMDHRQLAPSPRGADSMPRPAPRERSLIDRSVGSVKSYAGDAANAVSGAAATVSDTASQLADQARNRMSDVGDVAQDTYRDARHWAEGLPDKGNEVLSTVRDRLQAEPLMLAGVGLAIGAALGAAFPTTEPERRILGGSADDVKAKARGLAQEGIDKVKTVAEHTFDGASDAAREEARKQGLIGDNGHDHEQPEGGNGASRNPVAGVQGYAS